MEALKNVLAVLAGIVGVLTAILTLYAKFLDMKKTGAPESETPAPAPTPPPARVEPVAGVGWTVEPNELTTWYNPPSARYVPPSQELSAVEKARQLVKGPAIALIAAGTISLLFNLFMMAYGCVNEFVTPLSPEAQNRQAYLQAVKTGELKVPPGMMDSMSRSDEESNVILTIFATLCLAMTSAVAIWGGIGMLRLRGYWLSVAGSCAILAGGSFCCMGGVPVGVWSLVILFRPEVSSSFK